MRLVRHRAAGVIAAEVLLGLGHALGLAFDDRGEGGLGPAPLGLGERLSPVTRATAWAAVSSRLRQAGRWAAAFPPWPDRGR